MFLCWIMLIYVDLCCFMLIYVGLYWFMVIYVDLYWFMLIKFRAHIYRHWNGHAMAEASIRSSGPGNVYGAVLVSSFESPIVFSFLNSEIDFPQFHNSGIELCQFLNGVFVWKGRRLGLALRQYVCLRRAGFRDGALWICKCSKWNLRARCINSTPPQSLHTRIQDSIAIPHPGAGKKHRNITAASDC